ncbi:hypothetical protein GWI33_007504 [Rhynchophorus ferrugineus]|uniref:Uncharacterized protein n=1 Tax=Rhynchophorus ferrugineus TaxID=354439 RepID=A0A834IT52_RHYFE|nr:hypothetical protein GWI33_007504 [Rhynchophorus ferrugineus]
MQTKHRLVKMAKIEYKKGPAHPSTRELSRADDGRAGRTLRGGSAGRDSTGAERCGETARLVEAFRPGMGNVGRRRSEGRGGARCWRNSNLKVSNGNKIDTGKGGKLLLLFS